MKKMQFEKLAGNNLFLAFAANKLKVGVSQTIQGGVISDYDTSTALCITNSASNDHDAQASQENTSDSRCKGSQPTPQT